MAIAAESCRVALLGRDDGARRQLRQALEDLGAGIAFEGEPASASGPAALGAALDVVIINLEEGADDALDHLQAVLDDPAINVVFNDADASRSLEGWDLARWARHLAAKVLGHGETMPPVPEGAERLGEVVSMVPTPGPVPSPADLAPEVRVATLVAEAVEVAVAVPVDALPEVPPSPPESSVEASGDSGDLAQPPESQAPTLDIDFDQLAGALDLADAPAPERLAPTPEPVAEEHLSLPTDDAPAVVFAESPAASTSEAAAEAPSPVAADSGFMAEDLSLDAAFGLVDAPAPVRVPVTPETVDSIALAEEAIELPDLEQALASEDVAVNRVGTTPEAAPPLAEDEAEFSWDFEGMPSIEAEGDAAAPAETQVLEAQALEAAGDIDPEPAFGDDDAFQDSVPSAEAGAELSWELPAGDAEAAAEVTFDASQWSLDDGSEGVQDLSSDSLDDDVAALAAQLDAFEAPESEFQAVDLEFAAFDVAPLDEVAEDSPPAQVEKPVETPGSAAPAADALSLALAPMEDETDAPAPVAEVKPKSSFDFSGLDKFSLEPIDDGAGEADPLMVAMGLVDAPAAAAAASTATAATAEGDSPLGHVFVLGASIGGPDAVRSFLSELPGSLPAVFLLVQHLESGYFERLAQQLQKASALPVRIATGGTSVKKGEVLVIPAAEHMVLEADGSMVATPHETPPHYTPSIDTVLHDVADRFGRHATAIIFSGMAGDAVEGAAYLTTKGGEVWVQDPQSCVVSSMVDGARARGVVEFTGSPRELAQRCVLRVAR